MDHELVGLRAEGRRPPGGAPFALLAFAVALIPLRPSWLWAALVLGFAALPLLMPGPRPGPRWRLSAAGLELLDRDGRVAQSYAPGRVQELSISADEQVLTVHHKFGTTQLGTLPEMGFEPHAFFVTARRLGIPIRVVDSDFAPDLDEEQDYLDVEAALMSAVVEPSTPSGEPVKLASQGDGPARLRAALLGGTAVTLAWLMVVVSAVQGLETMSARFGAGLWALGGALAALGVRRRLRRTAPVTWAISADGVQDVPAASIGALLLGPGPELNPLTGEPEYAPLTAVVFDHRLRVVAQLHARGVDEFQLAHTLDEHGYRVVSTAPAAPRPSEYGLDGLPEIFSQVPGGRLVVGEDGLGWADMAGDVMLKMPADRIGVVELLTVDGHAWLRVYDTEGEEFLAAPLKALRIARTDLREKARAVGLPVTDAEYDAYLSAAFHGAVSTLAAEDPAPLPTPEGGPGALLDATPRARLWAYGVTAAVTLLVTVTVAWVFLGFSPVMAWSVPLGLLIGFVGAWFYDRNRSQLRVSVHGIASVTRLGRTDWSLRRETVGGVGIDHSGEGVPRLVVWSPGGRVLRRVSFAPDLAELRRACEQYGLPWGPPDSAGSAAPPPEI
ncbi:hypothetical protein LO762_00530 [Actinocorallia sp. API 0066]|uniref:hypothetical protein n=1 Tax=Actinocorallia sp. API 0066 TaxID=2896846 RepID=UPI001E567A1E|nr:hypothetical protein [Actinocorallia sp. API 0066]MCD0447687.1 hypothetical protein [Actinocorallia sp. API 0066]